MDAKVTLLVALMAATVALVGIIDRQRADNRHRFTDRKQSLYTDFWIECDRHRQQVASQLGWRLDGRKGKGPTVESTEKAERSVLALDLIAPRAMRLAAHSLFGLTAAVGAQFARDEADPWIADPGQWETALAMWSCRAKDYLELAKVDLLDPR